MKNFGKLFSRTGPRPVRENNFPKFFIRGYQRKAKAEFQALCSSRNPFYTRMSGRRERHHMCVCVPMGGGSNKTLIPWRNFDTLCAVGPIGWHLRWERYPYGIGSSKLADCPPPFVPGEEKDMYTANHFRGS